MHGDTNTHPDAYAHSDAYAYADTHPDAYADTHSDEDSVMVALDKFLRHPDGGPAEQRCHQFGDRDAR